MFPTWKTVLAVTSAVVAAPLATQTAHAASPLHGLTVAVTHDGSKLVAGGSTRTILVLDPQSLEVKSRHWIGASIVDMAYNKTGSILAVEDTSGTVYLYDTKTWTAKYTLQKHSMMRVIPEKDILIGVDNSYQGAIIHFNSLKDGSNMGQIQMDSKERVVALGVNKDGTKLGVVMQAVKSPDEKTLNYSDIPKDLRGLARDDFRQRNDGKISFIRVFEIPTGKKLSEAKTFFDLGYQGIVSLDNEGMTVLGYYSLGARIKLDGTTNVFKTKTGSNYGLALSPDQSLWIAGATAAYSLTANPSLTSKASGRISRLPSYSETFKGFAATADNKTIYGGTSAYRVVRIDASGKVAKIAPVR